ncbi:MAG: aquaporin family protein [Veillonellaceae bacterium]|jgi:glycerol uptake facilitator protein|nr:aquaporin family protein [Veillonellaceae bacterium]
MTNLFGEFMGTMMLMVLGCGVVASCLLKKTKSEGSGWMVITTGWGFGVIMGVFVAVATGAPQADLNPAVTLAKYLMGGIYTLPQAIMTMFAELAGGIVGAIIVWLAFLPHWEITEDKATKLAVFCTAPAIRKAPANLLCEIIGTIVLVFGIFCIFSKSVGAIPAGLGPYLVGVLVWAIGLSLGGPTGYAINPARDLGPRIAHAILPVAGKGGSDWGYSWIPVVGPMIGGGIAFVIARAAGIV